MKTAKITKRGNTIHGHNVIVKDGFLLGCFASAALERGGAGTGVGVRIVLGLVCLDDAHTDRGEK